MKASTEQVWLFPGQGAQRKGMGKAVFDMPQYLEMESQVDDLVGCSLRRLCLFDEENQLNLTQYTQPALYVVGALHTMKLQQQGLGPDYVAGHSLGEFNALFAAGVFDFLSGLKLVLERARLMSQAQDGGMAAVVGLSKAQIEALLEQHGFDRLQLANFNSPTQIVLSGCKAQLEACRAPMDSAGVKLYKPLNVSAAFHSRYMAQAAQQFRQALAEVSFNPANMPVLSNVTGTFYPQPSNPSLIRHLLARQIESPVLWVDNIRTLLAKGELSFTEVGDTTVLSKLVKAIEQDFNASLPIQQPLKRTHSTEEDTAQTKELSPGMLLGSDAFKKAFNLKYAYVTGSMYKGIASVEMVVKGAKAGLLSFYGIGGLSFEQAKAGIEQIQQALNCGESFGVNLLANINDVEAENALVQLYLDKGVSVIEASAFMQISLALVRYRVQGIYQDEQGQIITPNRIIAKVSRPEVAKWFLSPPPLAMLNELLQRNEINQQQLQLACHIPMAAYLTVEADSGGHTDQGVAFALLPAMLQLRDELAQTTPAQQVLIGAAGGIGSPQSAAAAFMLGADYITTGSINQCTVESGMSDVVKQMLQSINVQDTAYAPAGDMFELGAKVQVMKKGSFFAARANRLLDLYQRYDAIEQIPQEIVVQLEQQFFKRPIAQVWQETAQWCRDNQPQLLQRAEQHPKQKMALLFRWYFGMATRVAMQGDLSAKADFQVQTGPALGSCNQWLKNTQLAPWQNRHVDSLAIYLMDATAEYIAARLKSYQPLMATLGG